MYNIDILHIEDDPHCVELMRRALGRLAQPLEYVSVPNGEAALAFLADHPQAPRLLLLDLNLPRVGGLQVLEAMRGRDKNHAVPVIIFTSSQEPQDVARSYQLGANSYIVKPLEYKDFLHTVQQLVSYWFTLNYQQ